MKKLSFVIFLFCILFFSSSKIANAAFSMSILNISPSSVNSNEQEVSITATISGLPSSSFFRVAWQKSSGDTYFGYVKNNSGDWVKITSDQDCKNYYSVSDVKTNGLVLLTKIGDDKTPDNGTYNLKLRRYTSTCGSNSDSDPFAIEIILPTPTPTQNPTPVSTPILTPLPTPTKTPIATPTHIPTPTKTPTSTPTPTISSDPQVLGDSITNTQIIASPTPFIENVPSNKPPILAFGLVAGGVLLIGTSGYLAFKKSKETQPGNNI